jgi:glycosyltransferase involved in cell wall biosynthesis
VILPVYRAECYLERCIAGLLSQTYSGMFEILMIDNNSPDQSAALIGQYPRIRFFSETKQGAYAARNRGIREAVGDLLVFSDPDCVPRSDWLSQIEVAMRNPEIGVLVGPALSYGSSLGLRLLDAYETRKESYILGSDDPTLYWGRTSNMAVRAALMHRYGPFLEQPRGADVVFVRTIVDNTSCKTVQYHPEVGVKHLEISSVAVYMKKVFIYGRSRMNYGRIISSRPLNLLERISVLRQTIRDERYVIQESMMLLLLLVLGLCCWYLGTMRGWKDRP